MQSNDAHTPPKSRTRQQTCLDANEKLHSDNGPAVVYSDGTMKWCIHGDLHRADDLPAVVKGDGSQYWFQHNQLHRDQNKGPAVVLSNGKMIWYCRGQKHRDSELPAVISPDGSLERWVFGALQQEQAQAQIPEPASAEPFEIPAGLMRPLTQEEVDHAYATAPIPPKRCATWLDIHGKRHRDEDLPAVVFRNGRALWYQHGKKHRGDGLPAEIWKDGTQIWYTSGNRYRGPYRPASGEMPPGASSSERPVKRHKS